MIIDEIHTVEESTSTNLKSFVNCETQCTILKPKNSRYNSLRRQVKTLRQKVKRRDLKISNMKDIIKEIKNSGFNNENLNTVLKNYFEGEFWRF